jgi:hypothetical protein
MGGVKVSDDLIGQTLRRDETIGVEHEAIGGSVDDSRDNSQGGWYNVP